MAGARGKLGSRQKKRRRGLVSLPSPSLNSVLGLFVGAPLDYYMYYRVRWGEKQVKNKKNVAPLGVEPRTSRLVVKRSIQLSYGATLKKGYGAATPYPGSSSQCLQNDKCLSGLSIEGNGRNVKGIWRKN